MESLTNKVWIVLFSLESLVIVFANILSLVIFVRKFRHLKMFILLVNLAMADLMTGLFVVKLVIRYKTQETVKITRTACSGNLLAALLDFSHLGMLESVATLAFIALERAFAVIKPLRHRVIRTRYYHCGILLTWVISLIPTAVGIATRCHAKVRYFVFVSIVTNDTMSLLIMIASYTSIYVKLRFYPIFQHNSSTQMQMKLVKTLFTTTVASLGLVAPFGVYYGYSVSCNGCEVNETAYNVTLFLSISNSFVNFLIYAWKMPEFSREVKDIVSFRCLRNQFNVRLPTAKSNITELRQEHINEKSPTGNP